MAYPAMLTLALSAILFSALPCTAAPLNPSLAFYNDERGYSTVSAGLSAQFAKQQWSVWGFTDFHGNQGHRQTRLVRSFSEYRLSYLGLQNNLPGIALQAEINYATPSHQQVSRYGITYRHRLATPWAENGDGWLQWRVLPVESDGDGGQLSLIYNIPLLPRLHIQGFVDYNYNDSGHAWVIEPELNLVIARRTWLLLEWRTNDFERRADDLQGDGFALGIRHVL